MHRARCFRPLTLWAHDGYDEKARGGVVVETSGQMSLMFHSLSITAPVIAVDMRIINCGQLVGMPACSTRDLSVHGEFPLSASNTTTRAILRTDIGPYPASLKL